jgi:hypothetical protein
MNGLLRLGPGLGLGVRKGAWSSAAGCRLWCRGRASAAAPELALALPVRLQELLGGPDGLLAASDCRHAPVPALPVRLQELLGGPDGLLAALGGASDSATALAMWAGSLDAWVARLEQDIELASASQVGRHAGGAAGGGGVGGAWGRGWAVARAFAWSRGV